MQEFRVIIPDERYQIIKFIQEDFPGVAVINSSLKVFQPKEVFSWHCSVMLHLENLIDNGMPSKKEVKTIDEFGDYLDSKIKGEDKTKPNAVFLGSITWNKTRELIWRVFNAESTNSFLDNLIREENYPRGFDYCIDPDKEWKLAEWHLKNIKND